MNKKALILTSNRMNSYLKFNKELYNQNWEILNEAPEKTKKNRYVILYSTELKNRQTSNLEEIANFKNYHLYLQYEK